MKTINAFSDLSASNLHILNTANIVLLPKKDGAESITNFRPISLIHVVPKIIAKDMAQRLSPKMNEMVSYSQNAFINSRTIHNNLMYVRNTARQLHRNKISSLLIKLDIPKAFDMVRWDYMLDLMQRLSFPQRWRALLTTLFFHGFLPGVPQQDPRQGHPAWSRSPSG
jgi:hypothetical protein